MADFSIEIGFFSSVVFSFLKFSVLKNMENMTCCTYGAYIVSVHFDIFTWYHGT